MTRTFLIHNTFTTRQGEVGVGRCFIEISGPMTQANIEALEETIRVQENYAALSILGFIETED